MPLLPGLLAADGAQLSPFRGATFGQGHGSLPQGQPHPTSGPRRGTKAAPRPLLGTSLQGHPSSRAPGASLWGVTDGVMSPTALRSPPAVTTCTAVTGGCVSVPGLLGQAALFPSQSPVLQAPSLVGCDPGWCIWAGRLGASIQEPCSGALWICKVSVPFFLRQVS